MATAKGMVMYRTFFLLASLICLAGPSTIFVLDLTPMAYLWFVLAWPGLLYAFLLVLFCLPSRALPAEYFCKSHKTGQIPLLAQLIMLPFTAPYSLIWLIKQRCVNDRREPPYNEVATNLFVGRYPITADEFPEEATAVVDMTCEFSAPARVLKGRRYLCLPSLDCNLPTAEQLLEAAHEIATWRHSVYIHCANGHGRSTSLAALVLVYRGEFRTWREAFAHIQRSRALAKIHVNQEAVMDTAQQLLDAADHSDDEHAHSGVTAGLSAGSDSIVRRASSVQRRPFKFVRAASDGGFMEVKPSAPQDAAIVEHFKRTGRAIASRQELQAAAAAAALSSDSGAPKGHATRPDSVATAGALASEDAAVGSTSPLTVQTNALQAPAGVEGGDGKPSSPGDAPSQALAVDAADVAVATGPAEQ